MFTVQVAFSCLYRRCRSARKGCGPTHTLPSAFSSSAWCEPPTTCALSLPTAVSSTGEVRIVVVPSPSALRLFMPQLNSRPSLLSAMLPPAWAAM